METILAMLVVSGIFMGIPTVVGFAIAGVYILTRREARTAKRSTALHETEAPGALVCALDADCPPGYWCVGGRCVPLS